MSKNEQINNNMIIIDIVLIHPFFIYKIDIHLLYKVITYIYFVIDLLLLLLNSIYPLQKLWYFVLVYQV